MTLTRRFGSGRGRLSLRARLLAGLITVSALFLIVMGVVTTVVLGNSEQDQFTSDLRLTARIKLTEVAALTDGYAVAYINRLTRQVGVLSPPSDATAELQVLLRNLLADGQAVTYFSPAVNPPQTLFGVAEPGGYPPPTAIWRLVPATQALHSGGVLPAGQSVLVIARPVSAVGSAVRGLVLA